MSPPSLLWYHLQGGVWGTQNESQVLSVAPDSLCYFGADGWIPKRQTFPP